MIKKIYCVVLVSVICLIVSGCNDRGSVRPERNCPITELLFDASELPSGTVMEDVDSPVADYPKESAAIEGVYDGNIMHERIARWYYYSVAVEENDKWAKLAFDPWNSRTGSYDTPLELSDLNSLPASQIHIACADDKTHGYRCKMVARYEEYQIYARADISETGITYEVFRDVVLNINNKMISCLSKSK